MPTIALEMERLRNPYSGLGQYCLQLGHGFANLSAEALAKAGSQRLDFACLVPKACLGAFGPGMTYRAVKPWHKIMGPSFGESLWHCMHQDSEYMPRSRKTPLAITIHDLNFLDRPDYSAAKKRRQLWSLQQKINRAKGLVYISKYVQKWVREYLNVPAGMVERAIYNGGALLNAELGMRNAELAGKADFGIGENKGFSALPPIPHSAFRMPNSKAFLFSIGIHPKKNYHVLLPLLAEFKEYRWVIAGPDSRGYRARIEQEAAKLGVADRLEFCGPVGDEAKRAYYQSCTALLFPSLAEGFGLPVVEAMSLGKPVFLSERTSLPEIGGTEAYYFKDFEPETIKNTFEAGMDDYYKDPEKASRMMAWASQFNWNKAASQYLEFYQSLLT